MTNAVESAPPTAEDLIGQALELGTVRSDTFTDDQWEDMHAYLRIHPQPGLVRVNVVGMVSGSVIETVSYIRTRKRQGASQAMIARELNLDPGYVSRLTKDHLRGEFEQSTRGRKRKTA